MLLPRKSSIQNSQKFASGIVTPYSTPESGEVKIAQEDTQIAWDKHVEKRLKYIKPDGDVEDGSMAQQKRIAGDETFIHDDNVKNGLDRVGHSSQIVRLKRRKPQRGVFKKKKKNPYKIYRDVRKEDNYKFVGAARGTEETNKTGNGSATTCRTNVNPNGPQTGACGGEGIGGGGGEGGGDGDREGGDPGRRDHASLKGQNRKKKTKKDGSSSSEDSPMEISPPYQATHVPDERPERQDPRLIRLIAPFSVMMNHYSAGNCKGCDNCNQIIEKINHAKEPHDKNKVCGHCQIWAAIIEEHKKRSCMFKGNCVCTQFENRVAEAIGTLQIQQQANRSETADNRTAEELSVFRYLDNDLKGLEHFREDIDYKITALVGKGGNGEVYDIVIINNELKEKYPALKKPLVMKKARVKDEEIDTLRYVANHPGFVRTLAVMRDQPNSSLSIMEKADISLQQYLDILKKRGCSINLCEALFYWSQVIDSLVYLHNGPIIHKDIKAANILLQGNTNYARALLSDFDAVTWLHNDVTAAGLIRKGTPGFCAPEVWYQKPHGRPVDMFSVAKFLLQMVCPQFFKKTEEACEWLRQKNVDLGNIVYCCLMENPEQRPTAVQLKEFLVEKDVFQKLSEGNDPS